MHIDWSWEASNNPEIQSGTITINYGGNSISFEMKYFNEAVRLTNMIEQMCADEKSNCLSEVSVSLIDTINRIRYS